MPKHPHSWKGSSCVKKPFKVILGLFGSEKFHWRSKCSPSPNICANRLLACYWTEIANICANRLLAYWVCYWIESKKGSPQTRAVVSMRSTWDTPCLLWSMFVSTLKGKMSSDGWYGLAVLSGSEECWGAGWKKKQQQYLGQNWAAGAFNKL